MAVDREQLLAHYDRGVANSLVDTKQLPREKLAEILDRGNFGLAVNLMLAAVRPESLISNNDTGSSGKD